MLIKNLTHYLEENNLSIAELSRETNIPKSTISSWLKGRSPNLEQLDRVAIYFNTTIDFLAFGRVSEESAPTLMYRGEVVSGKYEIIVRKITQ